MLSMRVLWSAAFLACSLISLMAWGQPLPPTDGDAAKAHELYLEGFDAWQKGDTQEACAKFQASRKIKQSTGNTLNMARCHEQAGEWASARRVYLEAAHLAELDNAPERTQVAQEMAAKLDSRICWIVVTAPSEATVVIDGAVVTLTNGSARVAVDPGERLLNATGAKVESKTETANCPGDRGSEHPFTVAARSPATPGPVASPPPPAPASLAAQPVTDDSGGMHSSWLTAGLVTLGVGVIGVVVGGVMGAQALSDRDDAKELCKGDDEQGYECLTATEAGQRGSELVASAEDKALGSSLGFGLGGALMASGATMIIIAKVLGAEEPPVRGWIAPARSGSAGGLTVVGQF